MAAAGSEYDNINENIILSPNIEVTTNEHKYEPITEPMIECPVCLDDYNEKSKVVSCSCGYKVHIKCMQEYLLQSTKEPHCMHCRKLWDRDFQYANLTSAFVNGKYKKQRKQLLFELEKSQFPATMNHVIEYKKKREYEEEKVDTQIKISKLKHELYDLEIKKIKLTKKIKEIEEGNYINNVNKDKDKEKKQFIKPCPVENCRGFLSTGYKCGLCSTSVCSKCFEVKGKTKEEIETHTCDENTLKNAEAIKNETKGCPKCGVPIYKISGCDQMWCTICNVAFSWKTGRIERGVIHNPHYYQWMTNQGGQNRNPGDHVCGGLPNYNQILRVMRNCHIFNDSSISYIQTLHRHSLELRDYVIDPTREKLTQAVNNVDLRVRYLSNEIDEKHFTKIITQRDNIRQKTQAMLFILELYMTIVIEIFNKMLSSKNNEQYNNNLIECKTQLEQISNYCNDEFLKIAKNYKMKVYYVNENNLIHYKKMVNHIVLQDIITKRKEQQQI